MVDIRTIHKHWENIEQSQKLIELGFEQIGESNLFKKWGFVVFLDQELWISLYVDYLETQGEILWIEIKKDWYTSLEFIIKESAQHFVKVNQDIDGGASSYKVVDLNSMKKYLSSKGIEKQLLSIGFKEEGNWTEEKENEDFITSRIRSFVKKVLSFDKNSSMEKIFRFNLDENGESFEIIAIVVDWKLSKLLRPVKNEVSEYVTPNTEILKYWQEEWLLSTSPKKSLLKLRDHFMEITVSSQSGGIVHNSQKLLRDVEEDEIVSPVEVITEDTGFNVNWVNNSSLIKKLECINWESILDLEKRMRPNEKEMDDSSVEWFLSDTEGLLEVLVHDNDFVLSKWLTHQDLVKPLRFAVNFKNKKYGNKFKYKWNNYKIWIDGASWMQYSPFMDWTSTNEDITITNLDNWEELFFSGLLLDMIERYGFYEGIETSYRLEPEQIIKVFPHLIEKWREAIMQGFKYDTSNILEQ